MDIFQIIQESGLRFDRVAAKLFPLNLHPYNALNRVIANRGELKASQLVILSKLTNRSVDSLLGLHWSGKIGEGGIILTRGAYGVTIMPLENVFEVWGDKTLMKRIETPDGLTVKQFLAMVDEEITKLK